MLFALIFFKKHIKILFKSNLKKDLNNHKDLKEKFF